VREDGLDDAAQEVFVVVHRRLAEFRGEANLRTWIYRILLNVAANQRRRERRKGSRQAPLEEGSLASADTPQESAQTSQAAAFLHGFLAGLDVKKREVFVLAAIEELPVPEVAAMLDIPLNTAYTRLRSARLAFQAALAARRGSP
jgi:RNA polymerase sigma-70 factor (ECF subfamily)